MTVRFHAHLLACALAAFAVLLAPGVASATGTGGAQFVPPPPPPKKAKLLPSGRVLAPAGAPRRVKRAIAAANRIVNKPYKWGGGHGITSSSRLAAGYDCSGAVSHALRGGRFLKGAMASGPLMTWGRPGPGRWITVYAHGGHAYVVIAGLRFDTSMRDRGAPGPSTGPRWSKTLRKSARFVARHPANF